MKAVVFHGVGDIRLDDVAEPTILDPNDAIVRLTSSAICGTDLHFIRGTFPGMKPGTILGHEGVGVVEEIGPGVRNLSNPNGPLAGTAFFGGPAATGPFHGLQAERARVPFANVGLVKLPDEVLDDQAILLSDIFPTGYFGADIAEIEPGDIVAVFGCGPVGQFAIASARLMGAGRIIAVDTVPSRLEMASAQGAEVIDFNADDPIETIRQLTAGTGVDRAIDAVGVDAEHPHRGPAAKQAAQQQERFEQEVNEVAPERHAEGDNWRPGDAPSQVLSWAVEAVAKAGTLAIIGVYPPTARSFPIGKAMNKNLTIQMGNCNHRKYVPMLVDMVRSGVVDPTNVLTQIAPLSSAIEAYKAFDQRQPGWIKVELQPAA